MRMSTTTASGGSVRTASSSSRASAAWTVTVNPASASSRARPRRNSAASSATATRSAGRDAAVGYMATRSRSAAGVSSALLAEDRPERVAAQLGLRDEAAGGAVVDPVAVVGPRPARHQHDDRRLRLRRLGHRDAEAVYPGQLDVEQLD